MRYIICFLSAFIGVSLEAGSFDLLAALCPIVAIPVMECSDHYRPHILCLCALIFLWTFLKTYYIEKARTIYHISPEDLVLLKIIETNARMVHHKYSPHKKVINIKERTNINY